MDKRYVRTARPRAKLRQGRNDWYRIENKTGDAAEVFIYDEIGYWGVTAADFVKEFKDVNATQVDLHINSPGGEVFDGVAIYNAILNHRANVTVYIDGLAASAASFIAMAGDQVKIARNAQMMIHDASGLCIGNSADMRELAEMLDKVSDNIADIYAERTGGTVADWREAMRAETWYTANEAVEAGLADEVYKRRGDDDEEDDEPMEDSWDLSVFARNGTRGPEPEMPIHRRQQPAPSLAQPEMKVPDPVPPTDVVEGGDEDEGASTTFDPAVFRAAMRHATDGPTDDDGVQFQWDPETFKALLKHSADHAPAPPCDLPKTDEPVKFEQVFDPEQVRHAVRDALTARRKETAS
jgi:ATP-dependent Clp endopeptidase proteolytic subunit ClpP